MLRPFDGVVPYRLEMGAKLDAAGKRDLYAFWGNRLSKAVIEGDSGVLNLASKEYSRAVTAYLPESMVLTCVFGESVGGKVVEKGTMCKMARGQMVRWLAENEIDCPGDITSFSNLGYKFDPKLSNNNLYVFIKGGR